jgi:hypothetical protein
MDRKRTKHTSERYKQAQARGKKFVPAKEAPVMYHAKYWITVNAFPYDNIAALHFLISPKHKKRLEPEELTEMLHEGFNLFPKADVFYNENIHRSVQYHDHLHVTFPYIEGATKEESQAIHLARIGCMTDSEKSYVFKVCKTVWGLWTHK